MKADGSASASGSRSTTPTPLKRRRITRACDRCHRGGTKCSAGPNPNVCGPCAAFGSECTYDRPMKRRGPPARSQPSVPPSNGHSSRDVTPAPVRDDKWIYHEVTSHEMIESLVDAYHSIIYPIHPFFHWPSFTASVRRRLYTTSRHFHCVLMSMCALTAARLRDGAPQSTRSPSHTPTSETFYHSAIASFPVDLTRAGHFDYKRAKTLLAMLCVQYSQTGGAMRHLGDYLTLSAIDGFHNEARWPAGLSEAEVQERRRLFWSAYQIDVYTATTWGGIIRQRESQTTVLYPTEVYDDEDITPSGILPPTPNQPVSYLRGWNFVTDLYRILEHAVSQMRTRHHAHEGGNPMALLFMTRKLSRGADPGPDEVLNSVEELFEALPEEFKGVKQMTGDNERDRYGFQAANILITLQTVKMVMAGMAEWSVEQRCAIAGELVDALAALPKEYLRATSSPMLHHLAGVGHLLASIIQSPLSPSTYLHVRTVLLTMADVLSSIESHMASASGIAIKLREQVERIDRYMVSATEGSNPNLWGSAGPSSASANQPAPALPSNPISAIPYTLPPPVTLPSGPSSWASRNVPHAPTHAVSQGQAQIVPPNDQPYIPYGPSSSGHNLLSTSATSSASAAPMIDPILQAQAMGQNQQFQLPNDLFTDWSFMFGEFGAQGDAFDFLAAGSGGGDWQGAQGGHSGIGAV
ncbi:hypothetical protein IAU60_002653 [Kwoniella sp. DSM 27419]